MSKFWAGERVRVKDVEVGTNIDGCQFVPGMERYIGKELSIASTGFGGSTKDQRTHKLLEAGDWWFVEDWLEPVGDKKVSFKEKAMNIVTLARFDKDQQTLYKADLIDDKGNLTADGITLAVNEMAKIPSIAKALLDIAKEYTATTKKADC